MNRDTPFSLWVDRVRGAAHDSRHEAGIPMRDGAELAADIYLPAEDGPVPCVVEVTPYGKDNGFSISDAEFLQSHGYAFVSVDVRGRGKSEGRFGWWTYATRRRIAEHGDIDWERVLATLPYGELGEFINGSGHSWELFAEHDRLDDTWRSLRFDDEYGQIDVPCLHVSGWYDLEDLLGAFHHYECMRTQSPAAADQYLLVGPWSHVGSRFPTNEYGGVDLGPDAALDMDAEHVRWFDHWLKGTGPGIEKLPRVRVFEPGRNRWRHADRWPLSDGTLDLFLGLDGGEGALAGAPAALAGTQSYRYDPLDPALTGVKVGAYPMENPPLSQNANESRADVLSFTGEPLAEDLVISGWAHLDLYASSDCDDTEWHVKITDVDPDGESLKVTQGCLRAACRDSLTDLTPLTPGEVTRFDVEPRPTHHAFRAGHRVRLTITSSDYPWFARSLNQFGLVSAQAEPKVANNTVACGGAYPSRITLPVERAG